MENPPSFSTKVLRGTGCLLHPNHLNETLLFSQIDDVGHCRHPFDDAQDKLEARNKLASKTNDKPLKLFTFRPTYMMVIFVAGK